MFKAKLIKTYRRKSSTIENRTVCRNVSLKYKRQHFTTTYHLSDCYLTIEGQHLGVVSEDLISVTNIWEIRMSGVCIVQLQDLEIRNIRFYSPGHEFFVWSLATHIVPLDSIDKTITHFVLLGSQAYFIDSSLLYLTTM